MKIACIGGGPGGLYFAISMMLREPNAEVVVFERNKADDTFGWGVVLSDETLGNLKENDQPSADAIEKNFAYWDDVAAVLSNSQRMVSGGHGFCGIGRMCLLELLQKRALELGVDLRFSTQSPLAEELAKEYDVVVACDGLNSVTRTNHAEAFNPLVDVRSCKFVWLGTKQKFQDSFTFIFEETDKGWLWAHAYQFDSDTATVIIECSQDTYDAYGFESMSQQESIKTCENIFKDHLGGNALMTNANHVRGSAWINFPRVLCEKWSTKNIVLLGDAAATAHFSIGSGTKLALESAIALAEYLHVEPSIEAAFAKYEDERRTQVLRIQSSALNSLEWFENIDRYLDYDPIQFYYAMMTRSQRISHENLRLRDPKWLLQAETWFQKQAGVESEHVRAPMFAPFKLRNMSLENRIVVSPIAQYKAIDGLINDWHLVHYAERAKGGAALVCTEMVAISPTGRATLGCPGLYNDMQVNAWKRVTDFVHRETDAKICCQLGHSGARGSTQVGWEDYPKPLLTDNWELISASDVPWSKNGMMPRAITLLEMDSIEAEFVEATKNADQAGFDMLELYASHGSLLASFISPVTNLRSDEYGGDMLSRAKFPLRVFNAVRAVWPQAKPISVRISASDWIE
ncbi:MAG: FAD-dependent monooxygenase, partial [Rhizobiales bacterium]|nr:FAD-dependent monooxygenase [Hyphomicrobiales bacterium]